MYYFEHLSLIIILHYHIFSTTRHYCRTPPCWTSRLLLRLQRLISQWCSGLKFWTNVLEKLSPTSIHHLIHWYKFSLVFLCSQLNKHLITLLDLSLDILHFFVIFEFSHNHNLLLFYNFHNRCITIIFIRHCLHTLILGVTKNYFKRNQNTHVAAVLI